MSFTELMEVSGRAIELAGVAAIVTGASISTVIFLVGVLRKRVPFSAAYRAYRRGLGRAILLGLEFLVAADIIRTVAIAPSLENVLVLGLIVLIRTWLSFSLELEIEGRWPWQPPLKQGEAAG